MGKTVSVEINFDQGLRITIGRSETTQLKAPPNVNKHHKERSQFTKRDRL